MQFCARAEFGAFLPAEGDRLTMIEFQLSAVKSSLFYKAVPKEGIEPSFLSEHEFESCAYASSATSARTGV